MMAKHPFLLFGLPFMSVIVAGSFVLTPATAIRYEKHDRRVRQMTREEELGVGKGGRRVNIRDEYYVSPFLTNLNALLCLVEMGILTGILQRLAAKDLDNWEQKRVKRLPGEHDGVL
ncbi:cytochrome c oxidase assembly protein COX16-domain-containing protein [Hypoxylon sp. FL0543]|nr:cytochrome c oxidase assembly protein COX16-domain-containing protein [Hypoxylon sp. FL0543]